MSKVVMRYRDDLTPSLDGVSFVISPGEKVMPGTWQNERSFKAI